MRRQCFSTLRDRAIFSFTLVQTGDVSCSFARSPFTCQMQRTQHITAGSYGIPPRCNLTKRKGRPMLEYHSGLARRPTATTRAPVHIDPMLSMSTSFFVSFVTLPCFSPPCTLHGGLAAAMRYGVDMED